MMTRIYESETSFFFFKLTTEGDEPLFEHLKYQYTDFKTTQFNYLIIYILID